MTNSGFIILLKEKGINTTQLQNKNVLFQSYLFKPRGSTQSVMSTCCFSKKKNKKRRKGKQQQQQQQTNKLIHLWTDAGPSSAIIKGTSLPTFVRLNQEGKNNKLVIDVTQNRKDSGNDRKEARGLERKNHVSLSWVLAHFFVPCLGVKAHNISFSFALRFTLGFEWLTSPLPDFSKIFVFSSDIDGWFVVWGFLKQSITRRHLASLDLVFQLLSWCGVLLCFFLPENEPVRESAMYVPNHGRRKPARQRTLFTNYYGHCLLGALDSPLNDNQWAVWNGSKPTLMEETCGRLLCSRRVMMMIWWWCLKNRLLVVIGSFWNEFSKLIATWLYLCLVRIDLNSDQDLSQRKTEWDLGTRLGLTNNRDTKKSPKANFETSS